MVAKMLNVPNIVAFSFQAESLVTASKINARGIDDTANLRGSPSRRGRRESTGNRVEIGKATWGKRCAVLEADAEVEGERVANGRVAGGVAIDFGCGVSSSPDGAPEFPVGRVDVAGIPAGNRFTGIEARERVLGVW